MRNIVVLILLSIVFIGCAVAPIPEVKQTEQKVSGINTKQLDKIAIFAKSLELANKPTIYIYVEKDGGVNESGAGAGELPSRMRRQLNSILMDFGSKVKVIDSANTLISYATNNPSLVNNMYTLNGAITMYDKDIMSQSSGFNLGISFGKGKGEGSSDSNVKDKDKLSILGMDFYLKNIQGVITNKTSGKIDIRNTTRGYSFGVSINDGGIGVSAYKSVKDGVGLSVRKLLQDSMYDLVSQTYSKR